jgi:hypothetical protein
MILRRHGAAPLSPAVIAHTIITIVRKFCNNAELITPEVLTSSVPGGLGKVASPLIKRIELVLRRWLQNVQGVWQDGLVGKHGKFWLPSDGQAGFLEIRGRNLDLAGQQVQLRVDGKVASTETLGRREVFSLKLPVPLGSIPVQAELVCTKTVKVKPLDPRLGPRRAGCLLEDRRLVLL